jgi:hypothetical protein
MNQTFAASDARERIPTTPRAWATLDRAEATATMQVRKSTLTDRVLELNRDALR